MLVVPTMGASTTSLWSTHARATWAIVSPSASATSATRSFM